MAGSTARQKLIRRYPSLSFYCAFITVTLQPHGLKILAAGLSTSVLNWHRYYADSDPYPNVHCDADPLPDPVKTMPIRLRILPQVFTHVGNKNFNFLSLKNIQATGEAFSSTKKRTSIVSKNEIY
jgi:hypothetical protein